MSETSLPQATTTADPADMLRMVWRRKWMLLVPWVTAVVIGIAAALLLKPVYTSSTTLVLDRGQALSGTLAGVAPSLEVEQQADIMREQVQSSLFLKSVVAATGVKEDRTTRAWALKSADHYPGLSQNEQIEAFLVDYLRQAITVRSVSKGKLFQVSVDDFDPDRAHKFCEAVANQFVASSKARQLEAVQAQQEFSVEQLQIYKRALNEAEARLEAARRSAIATTFTGSLVNAGNVGNATSLLEQAGADVDEARQHIADLRNQFGGKLRDNDPQSLNSSDVNNISKQMNSLQGQLGRAMLSESSAPGGSPSGGASAGVRVTLARKNAELEQALTTAASRALPSVSADARDLAVRYRMAQVDLAAREAWRSWLESQVSSYQRQTVMEPDRDLGISRLQAEVEQARSLYTAFEQQSAAAQIAEAFQNAKVSGRFIIMQPANRPLSPTKPNRVLIVLLAVVLGALVGLGTVLIVEHNDQSMKNADEVEHLLGLPVLGTIPRVEELERRRPKARSAPAAGPGALPAPRDLGLIQRLRVESPLGLEFKRIYLNLARTRGRTLPRTLLVTSSTRGEGKTATSACLGITLAREHRQRTLLVDFDLRSPTLHRALGMPSSSWGLAQMLSQKQYDERFVRHTALENLDFLAAGKTERPTAEIVEQEAVEWFLREASSRYSLVVLDTAPTLAVPDPLILGRAVEGVLYVVKAGSTVRKAAEYGVRVQREARDNLLGVLMNDSGEFLPQYYGYKAHYYGYTTEIAEG
jgi:capsular exopolysaccharide synthesis family protein